MNEDNQDVINEIAELTKQRDKIWELMSPHQDDLESKNKELNEAYRRFAESLGIEYCKHDNYTLDKLMVYLTKRREH